MEGGGGKLEKGQGTSEDGFHLPFSNLHFPFSIFRLTMTTSLLKLRNRHFFVLDLAALAIIPSLALGPCGWMGLRNCLATPAHC